MVVIDTDVLLLAFAYQRDSRQTYNTTFLQEIQTDVPAITIYNLMELLGQLSFNLAPQRLDNWSSWLVDAYRLTVIWPLNPDSTTNFTMFRDEIFMRPFARMRAVRVPFLDALILNLAEREPQVTSFVTWNAKHFRNKSTLMVLTPEEYLNQKV